jgi:transposase
VLQQPSDDLQPALIELQPRSGIAINRRLLLVDSQGERAVFVGDTAIARYQGDDRTSENGVIALLGTAEAAKHTELAAAFGRHRNTVGRVVDLIERGGLTAVAPVKPGPKGPHRVTPEVLSVIAEHVDQQLPELMAVVEARTGLRLSRSHLNRLRRRLREAQAEQLELTTVLAPEAGSTILPADSAELADLEAVAMPAVGEADSASEPPVALPEVVRSGYMGAALYFPAINVLGLLEAARACFRLPNSELFGVRAVMLSLFYLSLLGKTTVEAAKHLRRWEFGPLIGAGRAPAVKTLRRKLAALVEQAQALHYGQRLTKRWIDQAMVATAYLYVDGHMKLYTGKRKLAEVWNSQRRMPLPGVLQYFVNDQQGRPLLFVTEEANASLAKAMPRVVAAVREVVGERKFTIVFDRGGYDGKLFQWLRSERIDFITYQRGTPKLPPTSFRRRSCRFEGRRVTMVIAGDQVKVGKSGPWRRIVVRSKDGHQTPILTSLGPEVAAVRIACLIFARWRQENFFRYMRERHGLDQLLGYAHGEADGDRLVANPEWKKIDRELKARRQELIALRAELGQAVLDEPRDSGRTAHGLKIAQKGSVGRLRELEGQIEDLLQTRAALPRQIPLAKAGARQVMLVEQKQIIDRVKITAYNAEEWLLDLLLRHYPNPHDVRDLLRSFARLSGEMRTHGGRVVITIDAPDLPLHRRVLRALCQDLNQTASTFPGTGLPLSYQVAVHHSEHAA